MATTQLGATKPVRPWVTGDFVQRTRIIVGQEPVAPYRNGLRDMAYNANGLMANAVKPLVTDAQDASVTVAITTSFQTIGWYVVTIPNLAGRTTVRCHMRGQTTATPNTTTQFSFIPVSGGATQTGSGGWGSSFSGWEYNDVSGLIPGETYIVKWEVKNNTGATTFTPQALCLSQLVESDGDLANMDWTLEGVHPVDVEQYDEQEALSVVMARECLHNNNVLYASQVNNPVTMGSWHIHTSGTTSTVANGLTTWYGPNTTFASVSLGGRAGMIKEWLYWPRPGTRSLRVFANGFVNGWTGAGDTCQFMLKIKNHDELRLPFTIGAASADYAVGNWSVFDSELRVPDVGGPLRIQLFGGYPTAGKPGYIQTLCLLEEPPTIPSYT